MDTTPDADGLAAKAREAAEQARHAAREADASAAAAEDVAEQAAAGALADDDMNVSERAPDEPGWDEDDDAGWGGTAGGDGTDAVGEEPLTVTDDSGGGFGHGHSGA